MGWLFIIVGVLMVVVAGFSLLVYFTRSQKALSEMREDLHGDKLSPEMNRFAAKREAGASAARTALADQLNLEVESYLQKENRDAETIVLRSQQNTQIEADNTKRAEMLAQQKIIAVAQAKGWDAATYLELEKAAELDRLALEKEWKQANQSLRAGFIFQMEHHQQLLLMTEYIGGLYEKAEQLKADGKTREHELIEKHIAFMEADFNGRQRLLQAADGQDPEGSDDLTNS